MGLVCMIAATAGGFAGEVSAGGDQVQHTYGEDTGYYDENDITFDDDTFPGQSSQNRTGYEEPRNRIGCIGPGLG